MTCAKRNCPQCASVVHTGQDDEYCPAKLICAQNIPGSTCGCRPTINSPDSIWETSAGSSHYEDDGPGRGGYWHTD